MIVVCSIDFVVNGNAGSAVYTTVEIVLSNIHDLNFVRVPCCLSGYDELSPQVSANNADDATQNE
jgi:hypothetical protein